VSFNIEADNKAKKGVALLSICSNIFLTASKLVIGFVSGSVSLISEGFHSGMDLLASGIAFVSVRKSSQPPDKDHAFGHGKFEDASGLFEALLIVVAAGIIIWEAIKKLIEGNYDTNLNALTLGIIVMGASAIINFFVSNRIMKVAKRTKSIALESDAWHLRTDVFTSVGVLIGLLLIKLTGILWLDSVIAILVACLILKEAYSLIRRSFADLMDASLSDKEIAEIESIIKRHESKYTNYHELKTRRAGPDLFVEFHLMFPYTMSLNDAHQIARDIETDIKKEIPRLSVIIHQDPCDGRCGKATCTFICKKEKEVSTPSSRSQ